MSIVHNDENDAVADKKQKSEVEPVIFQVFESGKEFSDRLVPKFHPELATANLLFMCRSRATKQNGIKVPGTVKRASPVEKELSRPHFDNDEGADFIIMVSLDVWNEMEAYKRTALVDHLLTRCVGVEDEKSGGMKFSVRHPQVQEFSEVVERHGKWNDDLIEFSDCLKSK